MQYIKSVCQVSTMVMWVIRTIQFLQKGCLFPKMSIWTSVFQPNSKWTSNSHPIPGMSHIFMFPSLFMNHIVIINSYKHTYI